MSGTNIAKISIHIFAILKPNVVNNNKLDITNIPMIETIFSILSSDFEIDDDL